MEPTDEAAANGNGCDTMSSNVEPASSTHLDSPAGDDELSRKRAKKRKKKLAKAVLDKANHKSDSDKRFETVVEQLKSREADELWVSLGNCDIQDSKMESFTEALSQNATVTAVDLSRNSITSAGAQALFEALKGGAAADLIELDLRGNPFTLDDLNQLAHLWKSRKHLSIMVGALKAQQPTVSLSPFALQANEFVETEEIEGVARDSSPVPANASPLVLQFFQMGEDDERPNGQAAQSEEPEEDADTVAARLWALVHEAYSQENSIAELGRTLREIAYNIQMEMDRCQLPMLDDTGLDDLKPHTHHALQGLHQLPGILDVVPPPVIWPTTPDEAQTAVGTHRLGVAQILAQLTSAGALILDEAVAKTGMVPKLVQLCFAHQGNNALHSTVASLLRMAFSSKISSLWQPMLGVGMGIRSSSAAFVASPPPLQRQLAAIGIAAADMPCGRRPAVAGFVVAVASLVKAATTDGHASGILQHHLQDDEEWMDFTEEGGALQRLLQEQQGCLYCDPPRLAQPSLLSCGGLTAKQPNGVTSNGNAGSLFNCRELMGMLHIPQLQLTGSPQG
ncbi:hypothetical protein CVIRNUC_006590 [Coccomyxa viridis]|uniref:Uncharacterized protein n=1 Tax=Coccomyxa viridis TaxID=1274662 RepID=A0AAV1I7R1_9CHLO|nr:hypothetical protein CVIRNUC_006590 [Coccomyxa viridis]